MTIKMTTSLWVKWTGFTMIVAYILTAVHHLYGGLVYNTPQRLLMPIFGGIALVMVLGLLLWYGRTGNTLALVLLSVSAILLWAVMPLVDSVYGHAYKDMLFLAGVPKETALQYHPTAIAGDFVYPPNDIFFEATGLVKLVTAYGITIFVFGLIRGGPHPDQPLVTPVMPVVMGGLSIAGLISGGSLLIASTAIGSVSALLVALFMLGVSLVAAITVIGQFVRLRTHPLPLSNADGR